MRKNDIPRQDTDVASRVAAQTLAKRGVDYEGEVRRLLDAALAVIAEQGTRSRVRVADIVAEAGLSNDAFYRHFASKEALVAALLEDGTERLARYLDHQMAKETSADAKIGCWVEGMLSQTNERTASTTLAVLWNGTGVGVGMSAGRHDVSPPLAALLHAPYVELGCSSPHLISSLVAHATLGKVADHLSAGTQPTREETETIIRFCLEACTHR